MLPMAVEYPPQEALHERPRRRGGRIAGDTGLDFDDMERREVARTLRVIAWLVAALCACLAIAWYVKTQTDM